MNVVATPQSAIATEITPGVPERADSHRALAIRLASQYRPGSLEWDDAVQASHLGVLRAIKTYDPAKGTWPAYAKQWSLAEMQRAAGMNGGKHKRAKHRHEGMQSYDPHTDDHASAPTEDPETKLDAMRLRRIVASLSEQDQRRVAWLLESKGRPAQHACRVRLLELLRARLEEARR